MPTFEDRNVEIHVRFERSAMSLVDDLFPPPTDPAEFLRYCWRKYGTGRTEPDCERARLDVDDPYLWEDLEAAGCGSCPSVRSTNGGRRRLSWRPCFDPDGTPLPWPEFRRAAAAFFQQRARRKAVHRRVRSSFEGVDQAVRDALSDVARALFEVPKAVVAAFHGHSFAAGADNH